MTSPLTPSLDLRVAIVGSGPAGIYAGNLLQTAVTQQDGAVAIDLFESLPAPYGLIRYGVAPDHPRIKGIVTSLHEMLNAAAPSGDRRNIRFIGNVEVGRDIALEELRERYDAVILATGAIRDAALDIPGIDLPGSFGAADFVAWYDGHPDVPRTWALPEASVAVIGNGNVALDVARVLAKHEPDLRSTEAPDNVLAGLADSAVTDVHVFGRRGPQDIKFTPIELRELGELRDVDIVLHDEDFTHLDDWVAPNNQYKVMLRTLQQWRTRPVGEASRRLHLHFYHAPVEVLGSRETGVSAVRFERTIPDADGGPTRPEAPGGAPEPSGGGVGTVSGTGEFREIEVGQVYRAVGYYGTPVVDAPFDAAHGVVPNVEGRVISADGGHIPGLYATGWIKRGPVGLIGHTKSDALETVGHVVADAVARASRPEVGTSRASRPELGTSRPELVEGQSPRTSRDDASIYDLLAERGVEFTTWEGWLQLDAHERALGEIHEYTRERVKVVDRDAQVAVSRDTVAAGA